MIFKLERDEVDKINLPFSVYTFNEYNPDIFVRLSYIKHPTLKFFFTIDGYECTVKEFFMDWFYYGFPKNHMKTSVQYFGPEQVDSINIHNCNYNIFTGKDYSNRNSSTIFLNGTCMEIVYPENAYYKIVKMLQSVQLPSYKETSFFDSTFYGSIKPPYFWFENERIGRLRWESYTGNRIGDYVMDSCGTMENFHKITIFRNTLNEFLWVDVSKRNSKFKNLWYNMFRKGNIIKFLKRCKDWNMGFVTETGPYICQMQDNEYNYTITIPRITESGLSPDETLCALIESLNLKEFLP
jgi:hypothetical protein